MDLTNHAVLEVSNSDAPNDTGVFTLTSAELSASLEREMLIGARGQLITGLADIAPFVPSLGTDGAGIDIDAGQGNDQRTISFEVVPDEHGLDDDFQWGDGSASGEWDAADADRKTQAEILQRYCRTSKTDSNNPATLHWGPFSDGTYGDSGPLDPFEGIVLSLTTNFDRNDPSVLEGTLELRRTTSFPDFEFDDLPSLIPDV